MKTISETIKMQRNLKNLTQSELAEFAEVNVNTIVKVEKDVNKASVETLRKILDVLGLDLVVMPKADAKTHFLGTHYPHFKESGVDKYLYRIISILEQRRSIMGMDKNRDVIKLDTEKLILRLYEPKLKTQEGQKDFYHALKALPDVTQKMSEEHILFWSVSSVEMDDNSIIFNCRKTTHRKNGIYPLPILKNDMTAGRYELRIMTEIQKFLAGLSPKEKIQMMDIFAIEEATDRNSRLAEYLEKKGVDKETADVIMATLDGHSFKTLI